MRASDRIMSLSFPNWRYAGYRELNRRGPMSPDCWSAAGLSARHDRGFWPADTQRPPVRCGAAAEHSAFSDVLVLAAPEAHRSERRL